MPTPGKEKALDAVVAIKATGTKPPLFLIHGSGLNVDMFKYVSTNFDADRPFYGVQALGLARPAAIPPSVEEISAKYLAEILTVFPDGPFFIAGYSYGGFFAFEIAKQLKKAGKAIDFLIMIDADTSGITQPANAAAYWFKKIRRQFRKIPFFVGSFIRYPKASFYYQYDKVRNRFSPNVVYVDENIRSPEEEKIRETYNTIASKYRLEPLDIKVALLTVKERLYFIDDQKYLGWDKFALKGVDIYKIPGDHKTSLEPPNGEKLAMMLEKVMQR